MKKVWALLLIVFLFAGLSGCCVRLESPEEAVSQLDILFGWLGQAQLTGDDALVGTRQCADDYTGTYTAECAHISGQEAVFGGMSVQERKLALYAQIHTNSGSAVLRICQGDNVKVYTVPNEEPIQINLSFSGGGNYITLDYENFTGTVQVHVSYSE